MKTLLSRYLLQKLRARRYLSDDLSVIRGFHLLVVAYAVTNLLARLRAASAQRTSCTEEDVACGVQAADLLVVEHTTLFAGSMFGTLTQAVLGDPTLTASIVARLQVAT